MISTIRWVPKGRMSKTPKMYEPTEEEMRAHATTKESAEPPARKDDTTADDDDDDELEGFDMETYDDEDEAGPLANVLGSGAVVETPDADADTEADASSDADDLEIVDGDNVMLVARADPEYSSLEVHIYNEESGDFYVHHDICLPAFPLSVEWTDCASTGSFAAIGTFNPEIEIWDLDMLNALEPSAVLGGHRDGSGGKKLKTESHRDAVMGLAWNRAQRHVLASASADRTAKIWDVTTQRCLATLSHHAEKVQSVQWNPAEASVLATGSFDKTICVVDVRSPSAGLRVSLNADIEALSWNPFFPSLLVVSTDDGSIKCTDIRMLGSRSSSEVFALKAHDKAASSVAFSSHASGLLASASADETVKLWDVQQNGGSSPSLITSKSMGVGPLFTVAFHTSSPFLLVTGGQEGKVACWETDENVGVERGFRSRVGAPAVAATSSASSFSVGTIGGASTSTASTKTTTKKRRKKKKGRAKKKRH